MQVETGVEMVRMELKYCERCGGLLVRPSGESRIYCAICTQRMGRVALAPKPQKRQVQASVDVLTPTRLRLVEGGLA